MEVLGVTFLCLAAAFGLLVLVIGAFLLRRYHLNRALGTFDASIRLPTSGWRVGVCRYTDKHLEWLSLLSLSPLPRHRFLRSSLEVEGWRPATESERVRIQPGAIVVQLVHDGEPLDLAMKFDVYAGLSSWIEAGPVIGIGTWR
ncbi:DUF2550 family protein [Arthrobacter agilis]|uniref:DUF2550 domain-containing protein n=1 Tax=Arthrobacter agilis TaxID=37921 RepID=UPI000B34F1A9|nr:DUF2550 domain-containing protein [Arthrobacter agilis]OUM44102.1 hypothetical protein B8W74_04280 [Arthrobacter agilis]PPB46477.1 DUF2550 domain-containing protein [Arthrobacter agilis]TPV23868.1 DUF2550 family protein [Arthrobacter agilis]VDR32611.1 Protein of uncharacterised function (DUF2550) [Arthrobacter agilis]